MLTTPDIDAATELWEHLASRAWARYRVHGPGVLLLESDQLHAALAEHRGGGPVTVEPDYLPAAWVPPADDFRRLLAEYDPAARVMLLVRQPDGSESLLALEARDRPGPAECFERWRAAP